MRLYRASLEIDMNTTTETNLTALEEGVVPSEMELADTLRAKIYDINDFMAMMARFGLEVTMETELHSSIGSVSYPLIRLKVSKPL